MSTIGTDKVFEPLFTAMEVRIPGSQFYIWIISIGPLFSMKKTYVCIAGTFFGLSSYYGCGYSCILAGRCLDLNRFNRRFVCVRQEIGRANQVFWHFAAE